MIGLARVLRGYPEGMQTTPFPRSPQIGDHATMSYTSTAGLMADLLPYVRDGLAAGDLVIYICHDHTPAQLGSALAGFGASYHQALLAGRLLIMSADEAFFSRGRFNVEESLNVFSSVLRDAALRGVARIRAVVEMTYLLSEVPGIERAVEFERRANDEIFARHPFLCVCPMNRERDSRGIWADILASHPLLYEDGLMRANPAFGRQCARAGKG